MTPDEITNLAASLKAAGLSPADIASVLAAHATPASKAKATSTPAKAAKPKVERTASYLGAGESKYGNKVHRFSLSTMPGREFTVMAPIADWIAANPKSLK